MVRSVLAEAVRNARKHGSPESICVELRQAADLLRLRVTNDGVNGTERTAPGVGLQLAMTEAAQVGGILKYGPDGRGRWTVRLVLPTRERDEYRYGRDPAGGR